MKIVTLSVSARRRINRRALNAFSGVRRGAHISFASADLLWKIFTVKRWELLKAMAGGGALTLAEAARRAGRDVKTVRGHVHALLAAGMLRKCANGKIEFLFDAVRVDFMFKNDAFSAYAAGKDLFGRFGSGEGGLSVQRREHYARLVGSKRRCG